ncbi:unnamed protein product [Caenorhabditis auriculariae]|uniref:DNA topoisomerase I n=1 Tax=Caenorhabditis auriculariae TaxID=2777116 RepID=A0A8S1HR39_9PELO|nr:unnamed protein product [Caenorhabditis auriculariae]
MAEVSSPVLSNHHHNGEYGNGDSAYGSQDSGMNSSNGNGKVTEEFSNGDVKKEVKDEAVNSDDDVPWGQLMEREKKKKQNAESDSEDEYKPEKKRKSKSKKADSDSEDDYKPEPMEEEEGKGDYEDDDDDVPLSVKYGTPEPSSAKKSKKKKKKVSESDDEDDSDDDMIEKKKKKKEKKEKESKSKSTPSSKPKKEVKQETSPVKRKKKEEEPEEIWEWWKEEKKPAGVKWNSLAHKGPLFAPDYEPLPDHVHFKYDGKVYKLSPEAEEVAGFYARMIDHEYTTKEAFNKNFFKDWRKVMTSKEREHITDLKKCDFGVIDVYYKEQSEIRKAMTKDQKLKIKEEREAEVKIFGFAFIDGHKQKVANFRIEPPGLFRGRGGHPKMGMLKKRIQPEDVIINCSKDSAIPEPPKGHKWKEVRHDNAVTWLCSWTENVLGQNKYIMLNPSSKIKGEKDYEKYETARRLKKRIDSIRAVYQEDWKSKEMRVRQRAVALYFIDKLALRAGNEKDVDEAADTVGCCSLRVEHIKLYDKIKLNDDDKHEAENVVEFDFLGKDSIRYFNRVHVEKRVYKNLKIFMENKSPGDDLFDRLDTATLNEHLRTLMPGLTVKVFRTYNASITLQDQLMKLTNPKDNVHQKMLSYNRANRQVAILCNHQRSVPKTHEKAMENLEAKIKDKKKEVDAAKKELEHARGAAKEKAQKKYDRLKDQYKRLKINRTDKDENKQIALGTSKLNYLDPRISVAWCKKHDVPIEKVFNKTQREKFRWAIDMTNNSDEEYIF